jgi:Ethanolamine utilization protein EutJ (predicted chaperonin)
VGVCGEYSPPIDRQAEVIENYFAEVRRDGYIVDGVDAIELIRRLTALAQSPNL